MTGEARKREIEAIAPQTEGYTSMTRTNTDGGKGKLKINVLLIDVGFANCGCAILQLPKAEIIHTETFTSKSTKKKRNLRVSDDEWERSQQLTRNLNGLIADFSIRAVIAELPGGGSRSAIAMRQMAKASAIVAAVIELNKLPHELVTPQMVKQLVRPKGPVSKGDVLNKVGVRWAGADKWTEHEVDACAAYLAAEDSQLVRLLKGANL